MLSHNKWVLGFAFGIAGCSGGGGYPDAPRLSDPLVDVTGSAPQAYRDAPVEQAFAPQPEQADYPPQVDAEYAPAPRRVPGTSDRNSYAPFDRSAAGPIAQAPPTNMPQGEGPRGTSGEQQRYDAVAYAEVGNDVGGAVLVAVSAAPQGSYVELTSLDSGRTIVALVDDRVRRSNGIVDLSSAAARQLGIGQDRAPVRVRLTTPPPPDQAALRSGAPAAQRMDAPPALLTALRRKLGNADAAMVPPQRAPIRDRAPTYASVPRPQVRPISGGPGFYVQVAALSNGGRADGLARELGGRVARSGSIYRVQLGPFANAGAAQRARDGAARRGYGDARIVQAN